MQQSTDAFENIKTVTASITQLGQQVTDASEQITDAAGDTLQSIESIQADGIETETQSQLTREQASKMGQLAQQLIERMTFFKTKTADVQVLTSETESADDASLSLAASTPANNSEAVEANALTA